MIKRWMDNLDDLAGLDMRLQRDRASLRDQHDDNQPDRDLLRDWLGATWRRLMRGRGVSSFVRGPVNKDTRCRGGSIQN